MADGYREPENTQTRVHANGFSASIFTSRYHTCLYLCTCVLETTYVDLVDKHGTVYFEDRFISRLGNPLRQVTWQNKLAAKEGELVD